MKKMKDMPYITGVKVRIFPSDEQRRLIHTNIGAQRFVYNRMVGYDRELHALKKVSVYCEPVARRIAFLEDVLSGVSALQNICPFLYGDDVDSQAVANGIKNYRTAWKNFHEVPGTSIPVFHKKQAAGSYQTNPHYPKKASRMGDGNISLKDYAHVTLPKLGSVHFKDSGVLAGMFARKCETRVGSVTISRDACGDYYASFQIASMCPFKNTLPKTGNDVGLDVNVKNFYTDSDGHTVENPKCLRSVEKKLAKQQRKLSRRARRAEKEGRKLSESSNYQKQRLKVAKLHRDVKRKRAAFAHRLSCDLVKNHDRIVVENLKIRNLLQNHVLAKSISDCAWGEFFRQLSYKAEWYGREFIRVSPNYTTQTCSECGYVMTGEEHLTLDIRQWTCPACKKVHDRDHNSARNILKKGLSV